MKFPKLRLHTKKTVEFVQEQTEAVVNKDTHNEHPTLAHLEAAWSLRVQQERVLSETDGWAEVSALVFKVGRLCSKAAVDAVSSARGHGRHAECMHVHTRA